MGRALIDETFKILYALAEKANEPTKEMLGVSALQKNATKIFEIVETLDLENFKKCIDNIEVLRVISKTGLQALEDSKFDRHIDKMLHLFQQETAHLCKLEKSKDEYFENLMALAFGLGAVKDIPLPYQIRLGIMLPVVVDIIDDYLSNEGYFVNWAESPNQDSGKN